MSSRLFNQNQLDLDLLANESVSSEQSAFPVSNLYNKERRSKVWRSNGYWELPTDARQIVFRETTAVDLTATFTTFEFNNTSDLLTEIKTILEAAGGSTYTVELDTVTDKFKITSDGVGGGGIFEIIWTDTNTGNLGDIIGFDSSADSTGALTYTADYLRIHTSEWIKWDFGISSNPDTFVLIGPRTRPLGISPSATIKLQGNETDVWTGPSYEQIIPYDSRVLSLFKANESDDGLHSLALRFWRLLIEDVDNANGYVEAGVVYLGDYFTFAQGRAQYPLNGSYEDTSVTIFSEGGQSFSLAKQQTETFNINWFPLNNQDKEDFDEFFINFNTANPFFIQIDSNTAIGTSSNSYLRYCKLTSAPGWSVDFSNAYRLDMQLREEL